MAGLKREAGAAVLQRNSGIGNDDARPKPLVIGLNERHHHPVLIGRRQAYGAAGPRLAMTGIASMIGIDKLRTLLQIGGIEKCIGLESHRIDIAHMRSEENTSELKSLMR